MIVRTHAILDLILGVGGFVSGTLLLASGDFIRGAPPLVLGILLLVRARVRFRESSE